MVPYKYTFLGHRGLNHCNPIPTPRVEQVLDLLELRKGGRVCDIGCGKAELLLRLVEKFGVTAVGVDRSPLMIAEARERAAARSPGGSVVLHEMDASQFRTEPGSLDLAACLGATEILGGVAGTLRTLAEWVRPGGYVLIGEGHWQRHPEPEFLAAMGATPSDYLSHADIIAAGIAQGLVPQYAVTASTDDWDRYEWLHCRNIERYAMENPDDPDVPALLARRRAWRDLYLRWGREMLGFGMYLFGR